MKENDVMNTEEKKRVIGPDDIDREKREYISLMNEKERQKLLANIAAEEEEERQERERIARLKAERRKNSVFYKIQGLLSAPPGTRSGKSLPEAEEPGAESGPKNREPEEKRTEPERQKHSLWERMKTRKSRTGEIPPEDGTAGADVPADCPGEEKEVREPAEIRNEGVVADTREEHGIELVPHTIEEACSLVKNDKYAVFQIEIANMEYLLATADASTVQECLAFVEECGRYVFRENFFPEGNGTYRVLLRDCRANGNALKKMGDNFLFAMRDREVSARHHAVYGYATGRPGVPIAMIMQEAAYNCNKQKSIFKTEHPEFQIQGNIDIEALTSNITKAVSQNAIEQAKRHFERQMEEYGEIDDEEEVEIRSPFEMSADEYDSYLTKEQLEIKEEAKNKYVDDDILIEQVVHNIRKHNTLEDPLYLIAIASVDLNTLIILEDVTDFVVLCEEQNLQMIQCSYIYAISKSGGHWYGSNHATRAIEELFGALSDAVAQNNGRFTRDLIYRVPNICIFKDIYTQ